MALEDINPLRPRYLQWTLFRDYHYKVFDSTGQCILVLATAKGKKSAFFVNQYDPDLHSIVYENHELQAKVMLGRYARECTDLINILKRDFGKGQYGMSVVNASDKRLYTFDIIL